MPGSGEFGPGPSPQQAVASLWGPSDSSNVMSSRPSCLYADELRMVGTVALSHSSADVRPPGCPSTQGVSCPSWHRLGVMYVRFRVVAVDARSDASEVLSTTWAAQ